MMHRRLPWLPCLAVILAGMLARSSAQTVADIELLEKKLSRSHLLDAKRFGLPAGNPEELFLQRLKTIQTREASEVLRKDLQRTPGKLDQLIQNEDLVKRYLNSFKIKELPPEFQQKFAGRTDELEKFIRDMKVEEFLKYAQAAQGLLQRSDGGGQQPSTSPGNPSTPQGADPAAAPGPDSSQEGKSTTPEGTSSEGGSDDQGANSALGRWLLQAADRFKDLDPSFRNSPALRNVIRELSHKIDAADERWKQLDKGANGIAEKWARLGQALPLERLWPEKGISWPRSLTGESWKWRLPEQRPGGGRMRPTVPRTSMPDLTGGAGWRTLWMLLALAVLGLILWKTLGRAPARGVSRGPGTWKLGPWPVQPTAVQTREELIRAFEYLSVLRLGPAARHWHHWAIASGLGGFSGATVFPSRRRDGLTERRRAAEQLASLYERARYAPSSESLPEAALATARRDLCLLAGVPVS